MSSGLCVYCQATLPPRGKSGPARRYCSGRCRQAALRDREAAMEWEAWDQTTAPAVDQTLIRRETVEAAEAFIQAEAKSAPPEDQLARAVVETQALAHTYRELGHQLGPHLNWRATRMSDTLTAALRRYFNGDPQ